MKKFIAIMLILIMSFTLLPASAEGEFIFLAINDVFQRNPSPSTIPIKIGSKYYVTPSTFTRVLALKTFYNEQLGQQIVYNTEFTLTFDLTNDITFDDDGKVYHANAVRRNGRVYLPIDVVAQPANFRYSVITSNPLGHIVRISNEGSLSSTDVFLEKNAETRLAIYKEYKEKYIDISEPTVPPTTDPGTQPVLPPVVDPDTGIELPAQTSKHIYLTFDVTDVTVAHSVLDTLAKYNYKATFFIDEKTSEAGEFLRRALVEGHFSGIRQSSTSTDIVTDIESTNSWMKKSTMNKTTILNIAESSTSLSEEQKEAVIAAGYRIWDGNIPAQTSATRYINRLKSTTKAAVLSMNTDAQTADMLDAILKYIRNEKYIVRSITRMDTPLNAISEVR